MSSRQKARLHISSGETRRSPLEVTADAIISAKVNAIPPLERHVKGLLTERLSACLRQFTTEFEATLNTTVHFLQPRRAVRSPPLLSGSSGWHLHLLCHPSKDGRAKRLGAEEEIQGGYPHCLRCVLCHVKGRMDLLLPPSFWFYPPVCLFLHRLPLFTPPSLNLSPYLCCCGDQFG